MTNVFTNISVGDEDIGCSGVFVSLFAIKKYKMKELDDSCNILSSYFSF